MADRSVKPFFFGSGQEDLYGALHASPGPRKRRGVVILNPYGWEALRAHRTLRSLADRLAGQGLDTLRFDYFGSGDSGGGWREASLERWVADAGTALREIQASVGVPRISLVGLRLGALIAAVLAGRNPQLIDRLVLWHPPQDTRDLTRWLGDAPPAEAAAFPLPDGFLQGTLPGTVGEALRGFRGHLLTVGGNETPAELPDLRSRSVVRPSPDQTPCWVEDRNEGAGMIPVDLLTRVVDFLT